MCDEKSSASVGTAPQAHAPTRISDLERHLGRRYLEILMLVQLRLEHQQHQILKL